jgi:hypothetical protein
MRLTLAVLAALFLAVLFVGCTSAVPNPNAEWPESEYPSIGRLWITNSNNFTVRVCGEEEFNVLDLELELTQSEGELGGQFTLEDFNGEFIYAFTGSITEDGIVTGTATRANSPDLDFALTKTSSASLTGTIVEQLSLTCTDNSEDQRVIDVKFF